MEVAIDMIVANAITWILGNIEVLLFVIALVVAILKLRRARAEHRPVTASYALWGEMIFYVAGIGFIYGGLMHAYNQAMVAPLIGWTPSPFEFELGWMEIALGIVALISLWRGYEMRLAVTIALFVFLWAAAAQHIQQMVVLHNYAPDNTGILLWFNDIVLPAFFVILAWLSRDAERF
jgi:hypothetical protein